MSKAMSAMLAAPFAQADRRRADFESVRAPAKPTLPSGLPLWRLKRVLAYVDAHLASDIRLKDLAAAAALSAHHFSELFRQSVGVSPYAYVLERRVERAKHLLRDSMLGVLDIALAVGFSDQSHFSKIFRRAAGVTPSAYRTIMWAEGLPAFAISEHHTNERTNVLTLSHQDD
jgi:transcriptional regulator GlxA family with amidase domain